MVQYYINQFSTFLRAAIILAVFVLATLDGLTNVVTANSFDCSICNGQASFNTSIPGSVTVTWYNELGNPIQTEVTTTGESNLTDLCPGVYQVVASNGLIEEDSYFNIELVGFELGLFASDTICNTNSEHHLEDYLNPNGYVGTWFDPQGNITSEAINPMTAPSGLYIFETTQSGCQLRTGVELTINQNANPGLSETYLICETYEPFHLDEQLDGADFGGEWFDPNQNAFEGTYDPQISQPGSYVYRIDTVPNCPAVFATLTILQNTVPNPGVNTTLPVCPNSQPFQLLDEMQGNPEVGGTWLDEDNIAFDGIYDTSMGEQTFRYRIHAGVPCPNQFAELQVVFTDNIYSGDPNPVETCLLENQIDLIDGLSGDITAGGVWFDPNGIQVPATINVADFEQGNYTYEVNAVGCPTESTTTSFFFDTPPNPGQDRSITLCETVGQTNLNDHLEEDTDPNGVWVLSGQTVGPIVNIAPGSETYTYTINTSFCPPESSLLDIAVDAEPPPLDPANEWYCNVDPVVDLGSFLPSTLLNHYVLDQDQNQVDFFNPGDGEFSGTMVIESGNSCQNSSAPIQLQVEEEEFVSGQEEVLLCESEEVFNLLESFPDIDNWGLSSWELSGAQVGSEILVNPFSSGVYTYEYVHPLACGTRMLQLDFIVDQAPFAGEDLDMMYCEDDDEVIFETLVTVDYGTYWWEEVNTLSSASSWTPNSGGAQYHLIASTSPVCPSDTATWVFTPELGPSIELGVDEACIDQGVIQYDYPLPQGYNYVWDAQNMISSDENGVSIDLQAFDNIEQDVIIGLTLSSDLCSFDFSSEIELHPTPEIIVNHDLEWCEEETINLEANVFNTEMESYSWTIDDEVFETDNVSVEALLGMNFQVQGTSIYGCFTSLDVPVTIHPLPEALFNTDPQEGCVPLFVNFTNLSENPEGTEYLWDLSGQIFETFEPPSFTFDNESLLNMSMTAVSPEGCFSTLLAQDVIIVHEDPVADFSLIQSELTDDYPYVEIENNSVDAEYWTWETPLFESVEWSPFVDLGTLSEPDQTDICLHVESEFGCVDSTCRDVSWITTPDVYVPNTPNQDGVNDQFRPVFNGIDNSTCVLQIFNRWGEMIFVTTDMNNGWLGESQVEGEYYSPDGVYTWVFQGNDQSTNEILQFKGHVQLLR